MRKRHRKPEGQSRNRFVGKMMPTSVNRDGFHFPLGPTRRESLRAVNLPTDELKSKLTETEIGSLALVKPGDTLGLKVTVGDDPFDANIVRAE